MVMLCLKTQLNGLTETVMAMATMTLKKQPKLICFLQTALNGTILMATATEIIRMVHKVTGFLMIQQDGVILTKMLLPMKMMPSLTMRHNKSILMVMVMVTT